MKTIVTTIDQLGSTVQYWLASQPFIQLNLGSNLGGCSGFRNISSLIMRLNSHSRLRIYKKRTTVVERKTYHSASTMIITEKTISKTTQRTFFANQLETIGFGKSGIRVKKVFRIDIVINQLDKQMGPFKLETNRYWYRLIVFSRASSTKL